MFEQKDNTYNELRENSFNKWLEDMEQHPDVEVRGGVKLAREYVQHLKEEIDFLNEKNALKDRYLKKMKNAEK